MFRFIIIFVRCITFSEIKNFLNFLRLIKSIVTFYSPLKLILFYFNRNINPYRSEELNKLLKYNKKKWPKDNNLKSSKKILVECFINQQLSSITNIVISKYLERILGLRSVAIIRKYDFKNEVILKSFHIEKIYKYEFGGILTRLKYIYLSSKIVSKLDNTKALYNYKLNQIDIGLSTYDTWIRYTKTPTASKINVNMVYILANALHAKEYFEKLLKREEIEHLIQAEKQFIPLNIFFQVALKNKVKVYARDGFSHITTRIYSSFKERHFTKIKFSALALETILKTFGHNKVKKYLDDYFNFLFKNKLFGKSWAINAAQDKSQIKLWRNKIDGVENLHKSKKSLSIDILCDYNRKEILKEFKWDNNKRIITIYFPYLIDGIYQNGRRNLDIDNYTWIISTLNIIKKIKKYNWILKEHPQEIRYNTKTDLNYKILEILEKYPHIKSCPFNINPKSLINFTDVAVTCNGTITLEYQSFGKKVFIAENSYYNHFGFKDIPKNKKEYTFFLNNLHKIKAPNNIEIIKAKTFLLTQLLLSKTKCSLIPMSKPAYESRMSKLDENNFWREYTSNLKKNRIEDDSFFKMFKTQIKNNNQHTFNFNKLFMKKVKINDLI